MLKFQNFGVESKYSQFDFERKSTGMEKLSVSIPSNSLSPSKLVRAIKSKSSRLGLGEGKHLLNPQLRRTERHQRRSEQLSANILQSATSQASIYSLMINQTEQDSSSISSFIGSNGPDWPFQTYNQAPKLDWTYNGYDSDDKESSSKYSDELPFRRRQDTNRSGSRGTHAFLRLAHLGKCNKFVEPILIPSSLNRSTSYLSSRFVVSTLSLNPIIIPIYRNKKLP